MEELQVEDWTLKIDVQRTRTVYANIMYRQEPLEWLNYMEVCSSIDSDVIGFLGRLGIDILKPSHLNYHAVERGTMLMYTGCYHLHGEIVEGEMDGWDLVIGQHCFSLTEEHETVPANMEEHVLEIGFEVVLPWILDVPIPVD